MKREDLIGKRFGKLTVIEPADSDRTSGGSSQARWLCQCDCGRKIITRASYLRRGQRLYCGFCTPSKWDGAKTRQCRFCEFGSWDKARLDWLCSKGINVNTVTNECAEYWCAPMDKLTGVNNRQGKCFICGKPVYAHSKDVPIYCYEHREYRERDKKIFEEAPQELLFSLIAGIFLRAREDYLTNADNQRSDAEVFFKGMWAQNLSLEGFDAMKLLEMLNEEIADESGRTERQDG